MAVQRRGAAASKDSDRPEEQQQPRGEGADDAPRPQAGPSVLPRVAINVGVHSLLMLVVPLGLFFASSSGALDPVYAATFGIPRGESKTLIGAVLAVLGVNVVIASFLISAFNEPVPPLPLKED